MTYSAILPYSDGCGFYIHLEWNDQSGYIHEFRPLPDFQEWSSARSFLSHRSLTNGHPTLESFDRIEVLFSIEADALLCKLTWG